MCTQFFGDPGQETNPISPVREELTVLIGPKRSPGGEHRERGAKGPPVRKSMMCLARETGADSTSWVRVGDETFMPQA